MRLFRLSNVWRAWLPLAVCAAAALACGSLGQPRSTPRPTPPVPVRWQVPAGFSVITPPVVVDGLVIYYTGGEQAWSLELAFGPTLARPVAVTEGVIVVFDEIIKGLDTDHMRVVAVDAHTGQVLWEKAAASNDDPYFFHHPQAFEGVVYYESVDDQKHRLYNAARAADGALIWQIPFDNGLDGDPVLDDGSLYMLVDHPPADPNAPDARYTDDVLALDAATGQTRWKTPVDFVTSQQLAAGGGQVYATADNGVLYALNEATGEPAWTFDFGDDAPSAPLLAGDRVYFGDGQGYFYARSTVDGDEIWTVSFDRGVAVRPAVGGGRVYVGSNDGYLHALEEATGAEVWRMQNPVQSPFASNPYVPPLDTQPILAGQTLYYFDVVDLFALQVP